MSLKSFNLNMSIHYGINLTKAGLEVISYVDSHDHQSDETIQIPFSYEDLKCDILSSYIIPKSEKYVSHEASIKAGEYVMPNDETTLEVLAEVTALKEFATKLEAEMKAKIKKD